MVFILPGGLGQIKAGPPPISALDPAHKATNVTLSNNNRTATAAGGANSVGCARGTLSLNAGKKYFEVTVTVIGLQPSVGLGNSSYDPTGSLGPGNDAGGNSWGILSSSGSWNTWFGQSPNLAAGASTNGDVVMWAVDFGAFNLYVGLNGKWIAAGSTTFNPSTPDFSSVAGPLWPVVSVGTDASSIHGVSVFNPGSSAFIYTVPTGFSAWG